MPLAEREEAECELVAVVGSYNLGKLSEVSSDEGDSFAFDSLTLSNASSCRGILPLREPGSSVRGRRV